MVCVMDKRFSLWESGVYGGNYNSNLSGIVHLNLGDARLCAVSHEGRRKADIALEPCLIVVG